MIRLTLVGLLRGIRFCLLGKITLPHGLCDALVMERAVHILKDTGPRPDHRDGADRGGHQDRLNEPPPLIYLRQAIVY